MQVSKEGIEAIKAANPIADVVAERGIVLKRKGRQLVTGNGDGHPVHVLIGVDLAAGQIIKKRDQVVVGRRRLDDQRELTVVRAWERARYRCGAHRRKSEEKDGDRQGEIGRPD